MIIVPYAQGDLDGVVSVILPIQREEFSIPITLDAQPDLLDIPGFYQHANGNFWVARVGNEIVGTIALLDIGNGQGALRKMFVKQSFRGREHGVAQRLLDELFQWCMERDVSRLFLGTIDKFKAAQRFYEKNGFTELPKAALPSSFPLMAVDNRFYMRDQSLSAGRK